MKSTQDDSETTPLLQDNPASQRQGFFYKGFIAIAATLALFILMVRVRTSHLYASLEFTPPILHAIRDATIFPSNNAKIGNTDPAKSMKVRFNY